jgi:hypothetical protein
LPQPIELATEIAENRGVDSAIVDFSALIGARFIA